MNLNARSLINKIENFNWLIECHDPSVICVTETWLTESILDHEFLPPGYAVLRKDRPCGRGGGVALFIKSGIEFSLLEELPNVESIWCKLKLYDLAIVIGAIYRPPNSAPDIVSVISDYIVGQKLNSSRLVLTGDFNAPAIDWKLLTSTGRDRTISDSLIDMSVAFDLSQLVDDATREDSVLDLVFVSDQLVNNGYQCNVVDGISDHKAVIVHLNVACVPVRPTFKTVLIFERADDISIIAKLATRFDYFMSCSHRCSVETLTNHFLYYSYRVHCTV